MLFPEAAAGAVPGRNLGRRRPASQEGFKSFRTHYPLRRYWVLATSSS